MDDGRDSNLDTTLKRRSAFKSVYHRLRVAAYLSHDKRNEETHLQTMSGNELSDVGLTGLNSRNCTVKRQKSHLEDEESNTLPSGIMASGEISFWRNYAYESEGRPFIKVRHDVDPEAAAAFMQTHWNIELPRIVTVIISNIGDLKEWSNPRQLSAFQTGLIKAANTTNMWIFTNGANIGISKVIGDAVKNELEDRATFYHDKYTSETNLHLKMPQLNLIGVLREDLIRYSDLLGDKEKVRIENQGNLPEENKYELNSDHTHFITVQDGTLNKIGINMFISKFMSFLSIIGDELRGHDSIDAPGMCSPQAGDVPDWCTLKIMEIPVVAMLIQGGSDCARLVLDCLKKRFPVVVLRGSGGLADLLSFAYLEIEQRSTSRIWGHWDPDYVETFLKPEITKKIVLGYPYLAENVIARNNLRDRILECVRLAKQDELSFLTILNMHNYSECKLEKLSVYLLRALFMSKPRDRDNTDDNRILKELYLTLDWNCPDVAKSEVMIRDPTYLVRLHKDLFAAALLRKDREEFVDLFLNGGFRLHKFITPTKLRNLFKYIYKEEFFRTTCWEGILGHSLLSKPSKYFIDTDLNWLIEACTALKNFINSDHLYYNVMSMYVRDAASAERKALTILTLWALFSNRVKLAKVLWKNSDQPIHLGLLCAMVSERLSWYVSESSIKNDLKNQAKEFTELATGVLNQCYKASADRAFNVLSEESPDWDYKTAVDIAANARTRLFLAHPCCQKWLTNTFLGKIRIRELSWGFMTIPTSVKILLCAFFVFPMYVWVRFKWSLKQPVAEDEEEEKEGNDECPLFGDNNQSKLAASSTEHIKTSTLNRVPDPQMKTNSEYPGAGYANMIRDREVFVRHQPPLWEMIYMMWTAPITKFYNFHVFYIMYLALFSYAVLYPSCGNEAIDVILCCWTALIVSEYIRRTWILYKKYTSIPLVFKCIEICMLFIFIIFYALYTTDSQLSLINLSPYGRKVILCFALLYFYYRLIAIYLPISPTLGPLLYRLRLMVVVDFVNFMKMALVIILAGGITMQALLFPDLPISFEVFRRAFDRAWFALFLTPIDDLKFNPACSKYLAAPSEGVCYAGKYNNTDILCPDNGFWSYLFSIHYLVLLKLILMTLLYALFASTASKLQMETDAIWKYQRYILVVDFSNRLVLPSPLSIFCYAYYFFNWIFRSCTFCCRDKDKRKRSSRNKGMTFEDDDRYRSKLRKSDYKFWRKLARSYYESEEKKLAEREQSALQFETITQMAEEIEYEKRALRKMMGKMIEFERIINMSQVYLENIMHATTVKGEEKSANISCKSDHHMLSRSSPYPGTRIARLPIADKYVPWEVMWIDYDPVAYSKPKSDFPVSIRPFVDEDILTQKESYISGAQDPLAPVLRWNTSFTSPAGIAIDRVSWIRNESDETIIYKLDNGLPMNPYGRTGLRGKGSLPRWGPNHYSALIATRASRYAASILEVLVERNPSNKSKIELPLRFVVGDELYADFAQLFKLPEGIVWSDKQSVIDFFQENYPEATINIQSPCYFDDPHNTDNAWKELVAIHVHSTNADFMSQLVNPAALNWRTITEDLFDKLPSGQSSMLNQLIGRIGGSIL